MHSAFVPFAQLNVQTGQLHLAADHGVRWLQVYRNQGQIDALP